jgi:ADP-ribosylglycohydrolase
LDQEILEKIYSGFLGKTFGVRLGAPVEPAIYDYKKIREIYGNITGFTKYYKTFAADDDTNGPVWFHRELLSMVNPAEAGAQEVAKAWLNYGRENIGMFWWGGDHISTEHTVYLNLLRGIFPPKSGSIEVNGQELAEQIGGQIFIDTWGLLFPQNPEKAADFAKKAASVSHDGDGLEGAKFIAACISLAFTHHDVKTIISEALKFVSPESTYAKVVEAVIDFHAVHPEDWYRCMEFLDAEWGYDKYGGVVHIIPNAGVCVLSLLYGQNDFARTIEIATMCGWDTDCNAGNVGTILGVMNGLEGLPDKYRKITNDRVITSSVVGQLNIVDVPTFVKETARLSCRMNLEALPEILTYDSRLGEIHYDFSLPGSTHGFESDNYFKTELFHVEAGDERKPSLGVLIDRMVAGDVSHIYTKTYYKRSDFSDERYKPCFAPQAFSGQTVKITTMLEKWKGDAAIVRPYFRDSFSEKRIYLPALQLVENKWTDITFEIPDMKGSFVDEIGLELTTDSPLTNRLFGRLNIGFFSVSGKPSYTINFSKQNVEFLNVTPFAHNRGERTIEGNQMVLTAEDDAMTLTGSYYEKDIQLECDFQPVYGRYQQLIFKAKGIRENYSIGFDGENRITLKRNTFSESELLKEVQFPWTNDKAYHFGIFVQGQNLVFKIEEEKVLESNKLDSSAYGLFGFNIQGQGKLKVRDIQVNTEKNLVSSAVWVQKIEKPQKAKLLTTLL